MQFNVIVFRTSCGCLTWPEIYNIYDQKLIVYRIPKYLNNPVSFRSIGGLWFRIAYQFLIKVLYFPALVHDCDEKVAQNTCILFPINIIWQQKLTACRISKNLNNPFFNILLNILVTFSYCISLWNVILIFGDNRSITMLSKIHFLSLSN